MKAQIVSFHCVLRDRVGKVISSTFNRDVITSTQGQGDLLKGLAEGLQNLRKGEKRRIVIEAERAYGFYDPLLVVEVSRKKLFKGSSLCIGNQVLTQSSEGEHRVFRVIQVTPSSVTLDGNHPLAGQDLTFDIETIETRDATSKEIEESCYKSEVKNFH